MKKIFVILTMVLLGSNLFAEINSRQEIFPNDFGDRTSATLISVMGKIKATDNATVVLNGGIWTISTDVTIPSYVDLKVVYGSPMYVSTGVTVTMTDVKLDAGAYPIFTGTGLATGDALFPYRYTVWGDTTRFDIGDGYLNEEVTENWIENGDLTFIGGSTQRFDNAIITNLVADVAVIGDLTATTADIDTATIGNLTATNVTINGTLILSGDATNAIENVISNTPGFSVADEWSEYPATTNVAMSGFKIADVEDIASTSGVSVVFTDHFLARATSNQTFANYATTKILRQNVIYDTAGAFTNSQYTTPYAGLWHFSIGADLSLEIQKYYKLYLYTNGVISAERTFGAWNSGDEIWARTDATIRLESNVVVSAYLFLSNVSSATEDHTSFNAYFQGNFVGESK